MIDRFFSATPTPFSPFLLPAPAADPLALTHYLSPASAPLLLLPLRASCSSSSSSLSFSSSGSSCSFCSFYSRPAPPLLILLFFLPILLLLLPHLLLFLLLTLLVPPPLRVLLSDPAIPLPLPPPALPTPALFCIDLVLLVPSPDPAPSPPPSPPLAPSRPAPPAHNSHHPSSRRVTGPTVVYFDPPTSVTCVIIEYR